MSNDYETVDEDSEFDDDAPSSMNADALLLDGAPSATLAPSRIEKNALLSKGAPFGEEFSMVSSSDQYVSRIEHMFMLSERSVDTDEVQDQNFDNSSGIRTSSRLQAKAWQEMKMPDSAPKSVQNSTPDSSIDLTSSPSNDVSLF